MYVIYAYTKLNPSPPLKFQNAAIVAIGIKIDTAFIQGLNFPTFGCVLSTILPRIGSFTASQTLATINSVPTAPAAIPISSVKKKPKYDRNIK